MHWIVLVLAAELVLGQIGTLFVFAVMALMLAAVGVAVFRGKVNLSGWLERTKKPRIRRRMSSFEIFFIEEASEVFETALPSVIFALFLGIWFFMVYTFVEGGGANIASSVQTFWSVLASQKLWKQWANIQFSDFTPVWALAHKLVLLGFLVRQFYRVEAVHKAILIISGRILEKDRFTGLHTGVLPFFTEVFSPFTGPQLLILSHKEPPKDAQGNPIRIVVLGEHREERFVGDLQVAIKDSDEKIKGEKEYGDLRVVLEYHVAESDVYYPVRDAEKDFLASFVPASIRALALKGHNSLVEFFGLALERVNSDIGETLKARFRSWGLILDGIEIQDADSTAEVKKEEIQARAKKERAKGTLAEGTAEAKVDELKFAAKDAGRVRGFIAATLESMPKEEREKVTFGQLTQLALQFVATEAIGTSNPNLFSSGGDGTSLLELIGKAAMAAKGVVSSPSSSPPAQAS